MAQPTPYNPVTLFQQEEANNVAGRSTVRTAAVDAEFSALKLTLGQTLTNLAIIQRDDTQLRDLVVTTASLSANVKTLFGVGGITARGAWLTTTAYAVKDVVETGSPFVSYICVVAHTSGTFATDRAAGKWMVLGQEPGSVILTDLTLTTGGITLGTNNTQDLAATANRFRSGYFGTSVFAATSVVTPLVGTDTATNLLFKTNGTNRWAINGTSNFAFLPLTDNALNVGDPSLRIANVFTPIIDSGTTGSLSLRTNNGTEGLRLLDTTSGVNLVAINGGATGSPPGIGALGSDGDVSLRVWSRGISPINFETGQSGAITNTVRQFQVLHTASANRNITITGSNGGNPTISTTAGSLAITPAVVLTAGQLAFPATQNPSADVNTLDDYEEQPWTPSLGGTATYSVQTGVYTKIGRLVHFSCNLIINSIGTGSTTVISGLPFTVGGAGGNDSSFSVGQHSGLATAIVSAHPWAQVGTTSISIASKTAAGTATSANAIFTSGTFLQLSGTYPV